MDHALEIGTHNGTTLTNPEHPSCEECPRPTTMTFAAMASATPTPTKRNSANKRPQKRLREILFSSSLENTATNTKVSTSNTSFASKHLQDYKAKVFLEFKHIFKRKKQASHTLMRISNLHSHEIIPRSLKNEPPKLKLDNEEINMSLHNEFSALTTQYNRDLTRSYIKHLHMLVHSYIKLIDDFPNKIRFNLSHFIYILQDPTHLNTISNHIDPELYLESMKSWLEDFALRILSACDEFVVNHNIDETLKKTATSSRNSLQANNDYEDPHHLDKPVNIREIDVTMSDRDEEDNDEVFSDKDEEDNDEVFYDSPSYITPEEIGLKNFKKIASHTNNNNDPNLKKNLNFRSNPNPNPNPNPNNNNNKQSSAHINSNNHQQRIGSILYTCNTATNEVIQSHNPFTRSNVPIVQFINPYTYHSSSELPPRHPIHSHNISTAAAPSIQPHPPMASNAPPFGNPHQNLHKPPNIHYQQHYNYGFPQQPTKRSPLPPPLSMPLPQHTPPMTHNNFPPVHIPHYAHEYGYVSDNHLIPNCIFPTPFISSDVLSGTAHGSRQTSMLPPRLPSPPIVTGFQNPNSHIFPPHSQTHALSNQAFSQTIPPVYRYPLFRFFKLHIYPSTYLH